MVGTQFHPEFLSRPERPHPLFVAFVRQFASEPGFAHKRSLAQSTISIIIGTVFDRLTQ